MTTTTITENEHNNNNKKKTFFLYGQRINNYFNRTAKYKKKRKKLQVQLELIKFISKLKRTNEYFFWKSAFFVVVVVNSLMVCDLNPIRV